MNYLRFGVILGLLIGSMLLASVQVAAAEDTAVLTENQIEGIIETCADSRYELEQLHASDALIRVNIGQEYDNISSRLMAPLNSRIALNGLDGVELSRITVNYNEAVDEFQQSYLLYEVSMSATIKTDCEERPVEYYSLIKNTRRLRAEVSQAVTEMNRLIGQYEDEFELFAGQALEDAS